MRIPRFYCPELDSGFQHFDLPDTVHRHAIQVLRLKLGAEIRLFNGLGLEYEAELINVSKRTSQVRLAARVPQNVESPLNITLLQGVSRGERMDYAIQKAVELGVNKIIPVVSVRCNVQLNGERANKRLRHWLGVIISACEQSGRQFIPELGHVTQLEDALSECEVDGKIVLVPDASQSFRELEHHDSLALLIGPEGGLTDEEIARAIVQGFTPVRFGPRVLRTETASAAALAVVQALWGDLL